GRGRRAPRPLRQLLVFFFQAEDGIRDRNVTGVQTCALPIFLEPDDQGAWALGSRMPELHTPTLDRVQREGLTFERFFCASPVCRSEERRVGKERGSRRAPEQFEAVLEQAAGAGVPVATDDRR